MRITWLGHASFLIESSDGVRIITDPYESGAFGGALALGPLAESADIVTVSHEHEDHNAVEAVLGRPVVVRRAGEESGIAFRVVESYHDPSQGSQRGKNRIFAFKVDGMSIVHFGDLGHQLDAQQLRPLKDHGADILLVPVGGHFTIDAKTAEGLVSDLSPSVVIPMHVKNDRVNFPIAEVGEFTKGKSNVREVGGSSVEIIQENLPTDTEIWVLKPAR